MMAARGHSINPASRSWINQNLAEARAGIVRTASRAPDHKHNLWHRVKSGLADRPQDRAAANAQRLKGKALARSICCHFPRLQHVVFPRNRIKPKTQQKGPTKAGPFT